MPTAESTHSEPRGNSVLLGFVAGILLQPLAAVFLLGGTPLIVFIGVTQLLYIGPAIVIASRTGRSRLRKGLIIAAAVVALLNAACLGLVVSGGWFQF